MGTSGERRVLWQGLTALSAYVLLLNTVNIFSILRDAPCLLYTSPSPRDS